MYLNDSILDSGLTSLKSSADKIYLCSAEPATYTAATSTYALANNNFGAGSVFPSAIAAGSPSGRQLVSAAVTNGTVTGTGTATHWAIVASGSSALLAAYSLNASQVVTSGNTFTLGAITIRLPNTGG